MASLTSIRNGIGTNLGNISTLTVFNFVPDFIEPPTAVVGVVETIEYDTTCLLYTSPSPRDRQKSRMPSSA